MRPALWREHPQERNEFSADAQKLFETVRRAQLRDSTGVVEVDVLCRAVNLHVVIS